MSYVNGVGIQFNSDDFKMILKLPSDRLYASQLARNATYYSNIVSMDNANYFPGNLNTSNQDVMTKGLIHSV